MPDAGDGFPETGERGLGVRIGFDVIIEDDDTVYPNSGGMSAYTDPMALPPFRRPPEFGGDSKHTMWAIDASDLAPNLTFTPDGRPGSSHGVVEPITMMSFAGYLDSLAETRELWTRVVQ